MIDKQKVVELINEWLEGKEHFLVDVAIGKDDKITVEIDHAEGVWIEDCAELSRDSEDYELEVGSAGLGQPFKVVQQYINHIGKDVEVLSKEGKKFKGILKSVDEETFTISVSKKEKIEGAKRPQLVEVEYKFAFNEVKYTKYIINFK